MDAPSLLTPGGQALNGNLRIAPLTAEHEQKFYYLILEQSSAHGQENMLDEAANGAKSRQLFKAITDEKRAEAFLVVNNTTNKAVAAVTYYDCVTGRGRALYLEDIVTTQKERGQGVGAFAMAGLAQIAVQRGAEAVVWECGASNTGAQRFYDRLNSERCGDRSTWRVLGALKPNQDGAFLGSSYTVGREDARNPRVVTLPHNLDLSNGNILMIGAASKKSDDYGKPLAEGALFAYRNYSTFRQVNGVHVEDMHATHKDPAMVAGMIEHLGVQQRRLGWDGHVDFTVSRENHTLLAPVLEKYGFKPLAYESPMETRRLTGAPLNNLAARPGGSIISALQGQPFRPTPANNDNPDIRYQA